MPEYLNYAEVNRIDKVGLEIDVNNYRPGALIQDRVMIKATTTNISNNFYRGTLLNSAKKFETVHLLLFEKKLNNLDIRRPIPGLLSSCLCRRHNSKW